MDMCLVDSHRFEMKSVGKGIECTAYSHAFTPDFDLMLSRAAIVNSRLFRLCMLRHFCHLHDKQTLLVSEDDFSVCRKLPQKSGFNDLGRIRDIYLSHWNHWRRGRDSNPRYDCSHNGFRDRPIRPLWHLSVAMAYRCAHANTQALIRRIIEA